MKFQYPLDWPHGQQRTPAVNRWPGRFDAALTSLEAAERVATQLRLLGFAKRELIVTSNQRFVGESLSPDVDPGVAVFWRDKRVTSCMAIDIYSTVPANLAAVAATLSAMRAIERHGGAGTRNKAFSGFAALPAPEQPWQVLGLSSSDASAEEIEEAYRRLAMRHHPDRGGSVDEMARINSARDALLGR
jgi:DnaJ domain